MASYTERGGDVAVGVQQAGGGRPEENEASSDEEYSDDDASRNASSRYDDIAEEVFEDDGDDGDDVENNIAQLQAQLRQQVGRPGAKQRPVTADPRRERAYGSGPRGALALRRRRRKRPESASRARKTSQDKPKRPISAVVRRADPRSGGISSRYILDMHAKRRGRTTGRSRQRPPEGPFQGDVHEERATGKTGSHLRVCRFKLPGEFTELYARFVSMIITLDARRMLDLVDELLRDAIDHTNSAVLRRRLEHDLGRWSECVDAQVPVAHATRDPAHAYTAKGRSRVRRRPQSAGGRLASSSRARAARARRNKLAAIDYRRRSKKKINELADKVCELEATNEELRSEKSRSTRDLRSRIRHLSTQVQTLRQGVSNGASASSTSTKSGIVLSPEAAQALLRERSEMAAHIAVLTEECSRLRGQAAGDVQ